MNYALPLTICLSTLAITANAQNFTGEYTVHVEGGLALPLNSSGASFLVENNSSFISPAPWAVTEIIGADALGFGLGVSYAAELTAGLNSGSSLYIRVEGNSVSADTSFADGWGGLTAALPGIHDDGFLIEDTWDTVATVSTNTFAASAGIQTAIANNLSWSVGVMHANAAQDLSLSYDYDPLTPGLITTSGAANNKMTGISFGVTYHRAVSDKLSLNIGADMAALANQYTYSYMHIDENVSSTPRATADFSGNSTVIRTDISAQLSYAHRSNISFTSRIGVTTYSNVVTGFENTLNPENTLSVQSAVFSSIVVPYMRAGVSIAF